MRIKKALWASLALVPATIVPLSTSCSCSQSWGFKTPIAIGTNIGGSDLDPYKQIKELVTTDQMVDLNGNLILPQLQTSYAIDCKSNNYLGYSLPEKWDSTIDGKKEGYIQWGKGAFANGNAGWYDYSSDAFVKYANRTGERDYESKKANVSQTVYSYKNNTLASNIQLVGLIGSTISSCMNYALQYQGSQIGTQFNAAYETISNLGVSWGEHMVHGAINSEQNRKFFESVFASNAISSTEKYQAAVHPTEVSFQFKTMPIVAYTTGSGQSITGVNPITLRMLTGVNARPKDNETGKQYWTSRTLDLKESVVDLQTGKTKNYTYNVYRFNNVPIVVSFNGFTKAYVNPTKNDSFMVSDYYAPTQTIKNTVGNSWTGTLSKFTNWKDSTETSPSYIPKYKSFSFKPSLSGTKKTIEPLRVKDYADERISSDLKQNDFIVLVNYAYKEYKDVDVESEKSTLPSLDRVTMTGMSSIFPAYLIDKEVKLGEQNTFFKPANTTAASDKWGYIIDESKINYYNNLFFELLKRSSGQGLISEASKLNDTSKNLLKFLAYMLGDYDSTNEYINVDTADCLTVKNLD